MQKWTIEYYTTEAGHVPVRDFVDGMPVKAKAKVFHTFDLVEEYGLAIGEPRIKKLEKDLWEIRVAASEGNYRFIFTKRESRIIVLLHAFSKKSQTMSLRDLKIARARLKEV